ncbi:hypothetical protein [Maricaulis maris]|uniref:hypothetical protein n=1 Tax=Maricaulis maris TaxID=74318 RepID=UPI003B8C4D2B
MAQYTGSHPIPRCPECNVRQRMAFWPFMPIACSFFLTWLAGMVMMIASIPDKIPAEVVAPFLWFAGGCFVVSVMFAIVFHSIAKPIRC